jgi:HlyD family secretion protein
MNPDRLPPLTPLRDSEFLPPISRWMIGGGWVLMGTMTAAIALAAVLPYNVTVRAPAIVRPAGELRLVQAEQTGTVATIAVTPNQTVEQGQVIAQLDSAPLLAERQQLEQRIQQAQIQLTQLEIQIQFIDRQLEAEQRASDRTLSITQAELDLSQRTYAQQQATVQADMAEAEAALMFAQSELRRYQDLATSGAVSPLQVEEKQAAVQAAQSQLARAQAGRLPGSTPVAIAEERLAQELARTQGLLAILGREREALIQEQARLRSQLITEQSELQRLMITLEHAVIRATSAGVVFQLNLRNPGQVVQAGDTLAAIAPQSPDHHLRVAVSPQDINRIQLEQSVHLRLDACPFSDYGTLAGLVTAIAPDVTQPDGMTIQGAIAPAIRSTPYVEITVDPNTQILQRGDRTCPIQPGMTANATIIVEQEPLLRFILRTIQLWVR